MRACLATEAEIGGQRQREPGHERDDQQAYDQHHQVGQHGARGLLDVAFHHRAADVEADSGERHEAADAHGDDQHQRVVQLADAELAGDRQQERRQHVERGQPLQQHADHDQQDDRAHHEHCGAAADRLQQHHQPLRQVGDRQRPGKCGGGGEDEQQHAGHRRGIGHDAEEAADRHFLVDEGGEQHAIDHGQRGDFRRRRDAGQDADQQRAGHQQGQDGIEAGADDGGYGRARQPLLAGGAGAEPDHQHQAQRHHRSRHQPADEHGADRDIGDRSHDQHGNAWRYGFAHHGRGGEHRGPLGRAVAFGQLLAHHRADGGDVGGLGARQAGDRVHAGNGDLQQAALHVADQKLDETHQTNADAAALHHQACENEEGNREQDEISGAVDHGLRQHDQRGRAGAPEIGRGGKQQHEADGNAGEDRGEEQRQRHHDGGIVAEQRQPDVAGQGCYRNGAEERCAHPQCKRAVIAAQVDDGVHGQQRHADRQRRAD